MENKIKIASEKQSCPACFGSGVIELRPDYIITCFECGGSGVKENVNEETAGK